MSTTSNSSQLAPPTIMDGPDANWQFLEEGMNGIMTQNQISYLKYASLYTVAYNICTSAWREKDEAGVPLDASSIGFQYYNKVDTFLINHVKTIREGAGNKSDKELLQYYTEQWDRYTTGTSYLNRLFTYLNRHWIKQERDHGRTDIYTVGTLALVEWKENVLDPLQREEKRLTNALIKLVEKERNGEPTDEGLVKKVVDSFVSLGVDPEDPTKASMTVYKEDFEALYIESTREYIKINLIACLLEKKVYDGLEKAGKLIEREERRARQYIRTTDPEEFIQNLVRDVIDDEQVWDACQKVLHDGENEDAQRLQTLIGSLPRSAEALRQKLQKLEELLQEAGVEA